MAEKSKKQDPIIIKLGYDTSMIIHGPYQKDKDKMEIECRTCMTSVIYVVSIDNILTTELFDKCSKLFESHDKYKKFFDENGDLSWKLLGYCGVMFLDWLYVCKRTIEDSKERTDQWIMKVYIEAVSSLGKSIAAQL